MNIKGKILKAVLLTTLLVGVSANLADAKTASVQKAKIASNSGKRICNIINGTSTRPAYMGPLLNFSSYGNWRLGLFGPTADIFPTSLAAPITVDSYYSYNSVGNIQDSSLPNATASGLSNSDRVDDQRSFLGNTDYIPDTRTKAEKGGIGPVIEAVFN